MIDQSQGRGTVAVILAAAAVVVGGCAHRPPVVGAGSGGGKITSCTPANTVTAEVVALEHVLTYNRFGAFNPASMIYSLRRDLDASSQWTTEAEARSRAGRVQLRAGKRPRPLVLRVNEGDCLQVTFWNMLTPEPPNHSALRRADFPAGMVPEHAMKESASQHLVALPSAEDSDYPFTRAASMHVNGLDYLDIGADGANVGRNPSSLVQPGEKTVYRWYAKAEGAYLMSSTGALAGGEGDGGQLGLGLFGVVTVEPRGSRWFRSQVTSAELRAVAPMDGTGRPDYARLDYDRLAILGASRDIEHSDLNAIVYMPQEGTAGQFTACGSGPPGSSCGSSFREFTTVFHDENKVFQAFFELDDESNPINRVADGMAINYGSAGMGAAVLANRKGLGPSKDCPECKFEEFFLSSWANGDPALVVRRDDSGAAVEALYADDPSNVHHSYLGDTVRFRNLHAGPKETHVFHLHAHQWLKDGKDPDSSYLDSQTISPGSSFSYEIQYGGSGNRNYTVGDSIFHCHLYPHFAAGMWELWRVHDVFEDGTPGLFGPSNPGGRWLPDGEIAGGTPNPALVPVLGHPLAPAPTAAFRGFPFYIPAMAGHRPPQPPLDMALDPAATGTEAERELSGGLPRHVIVSGTAAPSIPPDELLDGLGDKDELAASRYIAKRTFALNGDPALLSFARRLDQVDMRILPRCGTPEERIAMNFHAGGGAVAPAPAGVDCWPASGVGSATVQEDRPIGWKARGMKAPSWRPAVVSPSPLAAVPGGGPGGLLGKNFSVNGKAPAPGAPFADPCPADAPMRRYKTAYLQFDLTVNKYGWHDPQARMPVLEGDIKGTLDRTRLPEPLFFRANSNDCIEFQATNLIPSALNLDDFQVYSPTDTIGQHIHLVKFDVTSSDGSGNGWNYEDGTFAADEVRERLHAYASFLRANGRSAEAVNLAPKTHPMFKAGGALALDARGLCSDVTGNAADDDPVTGRPWCGAQSTVQRWWADPLLNDRGEDRTLRTVFTHDHFGPSSHQQHGFYAALVVEPKDAIWTEIGTPLESVTPLAGEPCPAGLMGGAVNGQPLPCRSDGGPTSYRANVGFATDTWNRMTPGAQAVATREVRREFNLAFADFAILYDAALQPVNPPARDTEGALPTLSAVAPKPQPEGISAEDPGTRLLNYRNEPVPLRIGERDRDTLQYHQQFGPDGQPTLAGDMAHLFWSPAHADGRGVLSNAEIDGEAADLLRRVEASTAEVNSTATRDLLRALMVRQQRHTNSFHQQLAAQEPWRVAGDPSTPVLPAYEGDPLKVQLIQGAQEEQHIFTMQGTKWLAAARSANSGYMNGQQIGISEHFEFDLEVSANRAKKTDYWFGSPAVENVWDGMWGIVRSMGWDLSAAGEATRHTEPSVARLPVTAVPRPPALPGDATANVCPSGVGLVEREYFVTAWLARDLLGAAGALVYNSRFGITDPNAIVFAEVPKTVAADWASGQKVLDYLRAKYVTAPLEPMVLRAASGDCLTVRFKNYLPPSLDDGPVTGLAEGDVDARSAVRDSWSYNLMPPIVSGLNFNDVRMSTHIGLAPQLVHENVATSEGQAVGINEVGLDPTEIPQVLERGCRARDGSFSACDGGSSAGATYTWYAGDLRVVAGSAPACPKGRCYAESIVGGTKIYTPMEFGAVAIRSTGDAIKHSSHGAVAALVVLPKGACYVRDRDGRTTVADVYHDAPPSAVAPDGTCRPSFVRPRRLAFRDAVLVFHDDLSLRQNGQAMPNHRMADDAEDTGQKGFNYRSDPLWARNGVGTSGADLGVLNNVTYENALSSKPGASPTGCPPGQGCGDPGTVFEAPAGMPVRFRLVHVAGHSRQHAFTLYGHNFPKVPFTANSTELTPAGNQFGERAAVVDGFGPGRHANVLVQAGGEFCVAGDYLFRVQENFQFQGGLWGIFRVTPPPTLPATCRK